MGEGPDGKGRVTRSWEYDTAGNLKKAAAGGFCYTYEYRADGKLLKKSSSGRTLISCTYFSDGKFESLTDVSGKTVHYHYDWKGELSSVTDEKGNRIASYSHTPGGCLKEILHGNGLRTQYVYDTDGNIIRLRLERENGETISDLRYEYDLKGNRTLKAGSSFTPEGSLAEQAVSYHYDQMDRLISENRDGENLSYLYDLCGNRLKKLDKNGKEEYNYNRKNQLISRERGSQRVVYQYDTQGNLLEAAGAEGSTWFSYNAFNQQTEVLTADGERLENQYDAEYLRAGMIENGEKRTFLYYQGELIAEADKSEEPISRYILGYGVAAGWNQGKEEYHSYHLDEQNSTAYITRVGGKIENIYQYDAFGVIRKSQERIRNKILYTGQQYDQISGQYYLRARYYNPVVGRFLQEDVYRGDGLNLYEYCVSNPVIYYDPSGYKPNKNHISISNPNIDYGTINSYGQRSGIIAQITPQMIGKGTPANPNIRPPGFENGRSPSLGGAGHARAHLLASNLGGSGDVESNLVTFLQNPTNNSDMKKVENRVVAYVRNNQKDVYYMVTPLYKDNEGKPYGVVMEAVSVKGDEFYIKETIIENESTNEKCK